MDFCKLKISSKEVNEENCIIYTLNSPCVICFKVYTLTEEESRNIEIFRLTNKIDDFTYQPILIKILEAKNLLSYNLELTYYEDLDDLQVLQVFIYIISQHYKFSCSIEKSNSEIRVQLDGKIIYCTNIF